MLACLAALALGASCVRTRPPTLTFPTGPIRVTARSVRPVTLAPPPVRPTPQPPTVAPPPITGATPVHASGEATPPVSSLDPRLAALYAQDEARLAALTEGLKEISRWERSQSSQLTPLTREQAFSELWQSLRVRQEPGRAVASVAWSPLSSAVARPPQVNPQQPRTTTAGQTALPLDQETKSAMEEEARQRALETLRNVLLRTELARHVTLGNWMVEHRIEPGRLTTLINESVTQHTAFRTDETGTQHVCEVELQFDQGELGRLH
jgi:hypothetical protein